MKREVILIIVLLVLSSLVSAGICNDSIDNDGDGKCDFSGCTLTNGTHLTPDRICKSSNDNNLNFNKNLDLNTKKIKKTLQKNYNPSKDLRPNITYIPKYTQFLIWEYKYFPQLCDIFYILEKH